MHLPLARDDNDGPTTTDVDRPTIPAPSISGTSLATRAAIVWHRGKVEISRLLDKSPSEVYTTYGSTRPFHFPYEIVEMIIAHLTCNLDALKTCSLTSRSWYTVVAPLLHHTLTLAEDGPGIHRDLRELLSKLHELGLIPLVKEIRMKNSHLYLDHFSAFANIHTLKIHELDFSLILDIDRRFEHFSPTLRSITLFSPRCTPRQLSHFLSLFMNLDNVEIRNPYHSIAGTTAPDAELVAFSAPKLRGRLRLDNFNWVDTWAHLISSCGGLPFRYMDLRWSASCVPILLKACAETLETLRVDTTDIHSVSPPEFNLSRLKVLRSLQVGDWLADFRLGGHNHTTVKKAFSTITSPVFSELVVIFVGELAVYLPLKAALFEALRMLNEVRPFKLVFLYEGPYHGVGEAQCILTRSLDLVIAGGLLDFLDSPPTIRIA